MSLPALPHVPQEGGGFCIEDNNWFPRYDRAALRPRVMKHFVLEGEHLVPFEEMADLVPTHRAFLQKGYDAGHFLCSGPQIPARGGFLIARAESLARLQGILAEQPFTKAKKMRFSRITEFNPVQHQPVLKDWFAKR